MYSIQCKRIYEEKTDKDGFRILTDRLWPRGITKERAALDNWAKEMSPSTFLRKTFNHKEENFPLFEKKYWEELENFKLRFSLLSVSTDGLRLPSFMPILHLSLQFTYCHNPSLRRLLVSFSGLRLYLLRDSFCIRAVFGSLQPLCINTIFGKFE